MRSTFFPGHAFRPATTIRLGGGLLTAAVVLSLLPMAAQPVAAAPPVGAGRPAPGAGARTVTLITGDRVTVTGAGHTAIERGPGRAEATFATYRRGGEVHVIPLDALPLVQTGRLDRRLFDVAGLLAAGYDRRGDLPLIVTYAGEARRSVALGGATTGVQVTRELPAVNGSAVRVAEASTGTFWRALTGASAAAAAKGGGAAGTLPADVAKVWLDGVRKPALDVSVPLVGAPVAWQAGFDGTGTRVAVLDTGIDATHPDLADRVVAQMNFTEGTEDDRDLVGHGTHVASTVAGSGAASNGRLKGVAPGAKVLDGKVCVEFGCLESWLLAGMQWAAEQRVDVVNMSLGGSDTPEIDPVEAAVNSLTAEFGVLFVIAAGNSGGFEPVSSPSTADAALSVGAVTKTDELADFSSRGPRTGDAAVKPDMTAPGVDITAARGKDGFIGTPGQPYATISGTSMATPHVAGAAAILAQRRPDLSPAELKATLMGSARPNPSLGAYEQGAGRLDVARAIDTQVTADPPSVSFGRQLWPHQDDTQVTKTVTYRNRGSADVTLTLALRTGSSPTGTFSLGATSVTVPAGGQASVTLTADTRVAGPEGLLTGQLTATAGGTVVQTPFGVDREVESYDLTLNFIGRDGAPAAEQFSLLIQVDGNFFAFIAFDPDGTLTLRVPRGRYFLASDIFKFPEDPAEQFQLTALTQPRLDVTAAQTVAVDARVGRPVRVTVPRADASQVAAEIDRILETPDSLIAVGAFIGNFDGLSTGQLGPDQTVDGFTSKIGGLWAQVDADGNPTDSPYVYTAAYFTQGRMVTGLERRIAEKDLATVRARHAIQATDSFGIKGAFAMPSFDLHALSAVLISFRLPFTRTEFYLTEGGIRWLPIFDERLESEFVYGAEGLPTRYRAGRTHVEDWNRAVFGPGLGQPSLPFLFVTRTGNQLIVVPSMFSDSTGRAGFAPLDSARLTLFRNGTKIVDEPELAGVFEVPAANAQYRLEIGAQRAATGTLSTQVSGVWTFRSGQVAGTQPARLPLWTATFAPNVDDHQTAPAGRLFFVPVTVDSQPGSAVGRLRRLTVEVSYDDGRTWRSAPVVGFGNSRHVLLHHPQGTGFVSLRAGASDDRGNIVVQTVIRAYRVVPG